MRIHFALQTITLFFSLNAVAGNHSMIFNINNATLCMVEEDNNPANVPAGFVWAKVVNGTISECGASNVTQPCPYAQEVVMFSGSNYEKPGSQFLAWAGIRKLENGTVQLYNPNQEDGCLYGVAQDAEPTDYPSYDPPDTSLSSLVLVTAVTIVGIGAGVLGIYGITKFRQKYPHGIHECWMSIKKEWQTRRNEGRRLVLVNGGYGSV